MNQIDLVTFAQYSQKIPGKYLVPESKSKPIETWEILVMHLIDFVFIFSLTSLLSTVYNQSVKSVLVVRSIRAAFSYHDMGLTGILLPLAIMTYFFFCYFMNHGQSCGMFLLKKRIEMKPNSFKEALKWGAHSALLCLSCGLSFLPRIDQWTSIKSHDYLYEDLVSYRDVHGFNLLSKTHELSDEYVRENDWVKAA